ncbi:unnamed protein product [Rotaria magnacalcarata]|uniref:Uncharacterized protein n=1 Tax=Rotaria magnacalcarata TaxID=392030 RepID=A0A816YCY4_9BILA|nr:unnamed protein product [Rotaria magnacalcarata]
MSCRFLHPKSQGSPAFEVADLFEIPSTQNSISSSSIISVGPVNTIDSLDHSQNLDYYVPSFADHMLDLNNVYIFFKLGLRYADGTVPPASSTLVPAQDFATSYIKSLEIFLNDVQIDNTPLHYALSNHIGYLFNTSNSAKTGILSASHYNLDYDEFKDRFKKSVSKNFDTYTRLSCPLFNQEKLLVSNVDLKIRLTRTSPKFHLNTQSDTEIAKAPFCSILETYLVIRKSKLTPNTYLAVENRLQADTAKYVMQSVVQRQHILPSSILSYSINQLQQGSLPSKLLIFFQSNKSSNGDYKADCFKFHHYNISSCSLYVNGILIGKPYVTTFSSDEKEIPLVARAFHDLQLLLDDASPEGNGISMMQYNDNTAIFGFDLSSSYTDCQSVLNPVETGDISIKLTFNAALPEAVTCNILMVFPAILEIDGSRQIILKQL